MPEQRELVERLEARFADLELYVEPRTGEVTAEVPAGRLLAISTALRDEEEFGFRQLVDLCGVDYLDFGRVEWETSERATSGGFSRGVERDLSREPPPATLPDGQPRFAVVYHLLSHQNNERLRLRARASGEPPVIDSVVEVWSSANWFEREAFDLFGILFQGHPDLRRILTDYGFVGHPFRKDFPLSGHVEMRFDPDRGRVVYEPVSIEPRVLVPRVIRHDARYHAEHSDEGGENA